MGKLKRTRELELRQAEEYCRDWSFINLSNIMMILSIHTTLFFEYYGCGHDCHSC